MAKPSLRTYLVAVGLMGMGLVLLVLCGVGWAQGVEPRWSVGLFALLGLYTVALGLDEGWLSGLEVHPNRLRIRSFGRWEEHPLAQIQGMDALRDILGGSLLLVLLKADGSAIRVPLRRYANAKELAQALLDAAWQGNKELVVMPRVARRWGEPPFGVFTQKKAHRS